MKKVVFGVVTLMLLLSMGSCWNHKDNSNEVLAQKQEDLMQEANRQVGMPAIKNFQERKLMKMIMELRDQENLVCYAYLKSEYTGKLTFFGKCIGYGLPYSVQYTNPEVVVPTYTNGGRIWNVLPQADPNGLFMPSGLAATWVMMIDPKTNEPHPVYVESDVIISPFPLQDLN